MAVNQSRSMIDEFSQGIIDNTYMTLTPNRGVVQHPPTERLSWPGYQQCEQHCEDPFTESMQGHAQHHVERKVSY